MAKISDAANVISAYRFMWKHEFVLTANGYTCEGCGAILTLEQVAAASESEAEFIEFVKASGLGVECIPGESTRDDD